MEVSQDILFIENPDCILGSSKERYFGYGYKATIHKFIECETIGFKLFATLNVIWSNLWSIKDGESLKPHISSLDFYIVSMLLIENYFQTILKFNYDSLFKMWIDEYACKVGAHAIESEISKCCCEIVNKTKLNNKLIYNFKISICGVSILVKVSQLINPCIGSAQTLLSKKKYQPKLVFTSLPNQIECINYYEKVYKCLERKITNIIVSRKQKTIYANFLLTNWINDVVISGIATAWMPYITVDDVMLVAGQMTQILIYTLDNTSRKESGNLWLRDIRCIYNRKVSVETQVCVKIISSNIVNVKGINYRNMNLRFDFGHGDLIANCKAAYIINNCEK